MAQREWSHRAMEGVPGSQVFDTATNWRLISECIRAVLQSPGIDTSAIRAVSTTSMREGMVLYDKRGREIWACPNVDSRAGTEATELVQRGLAEKIYRQGRDRVAITAPARLRWIKRHEPAIIRDAAHIKLLADRIAYRLSGEFFTDPSIGSSSGMFDLATRTWSPEIMDICGMNREIFPSVLEPGTVAGQVTAGAAAATAWRQRTPLHLG